MNLPFFTEALSLQMILESVQEILAAKIGHARIPAGYWSLFRGIYPEISQQP